jgi:hypothetical protein
MAYTLEQFCTDCRQHLDADPGPGGRERIRQDLERLLAEPTFVERYCGSDAERGVNVLYEDTGLGFQVLVHINAEARKSPPHDHGESWAIYGQATEYTEMVEWIRTDDRSDPGSGAVEPEKTYRLTPGKAGIYADGKIHSIDYPDNARFVRVTGTNLDRIERIAFNLETGKINRMGAQRAS